MRGLGFFPSDYLVECLHHELQLGGKRKIPFEDLVKLFVNYSHWISCDTEGGSLETSLKNLFLPLQNESVGELVLSKDQLLFLLTETAEKVDEKDAEIYLKEFFRNSKEIPLTDFMQRISKFSNRNLP